MLFPVLVTGVASDDFFIGKKMVEVCENILPLVWKKIYKAEKKNQCMR